MYRVARASGLGVVAAGQLSRLRPELCRSDDPDFYRDVWEGAHAATSSARICAPSPAARLSAGEAPALIPPAIDPQLFCPDDGEGPEHDGRCGRPLRILSVGRLEWKKGYEYALAAVRRLIDRGVSCEYRIIGGGDFLEPVAFARHQLGLEQLVRLLGPLSGDQVKAELRQAGLFLHAAVSEGFCNAVLEAQAVGLPVVTTDADGLPENVADGVTGFVVPRATRRRWRRSWRCSLATLACASNWWRGPRRVLARFRLVDQAAAFDLLYSQVLTGEPERSGRLP